MVTILRPDEVKAKYGPLFCRGYITVVDEKAGKAKIIERCCSRGPGEWDIVNRRRTGGVIEKIVMDGASLIMDVRIGEGELRFGPVSADLGGQGLKAVKVEGDEVRTTWYGIAGASIGIGACLPQCPDVLRTEYPDDFKIGGGHTAHVDIITPKMVRVIIGIDDTDTKEKGATWASGLKLGQTCPIGHFLEHKIIQLNPRTPTKTTNCCSTAVTFAVKEDEVPKLIEYCVEFIRKESYSTDAVMTVYQGLEVPRKLTEYAWSAKTRMYTVDEAVAVAEECGVQIISITGTGGIIGAVAAIGCADLGPEAAGVPEDFPEFKI
jgi:Predicted DNA-binding protein containing a Zn-ribbon domain